MPRRRPAPGPRAAPEEQIERVREHRLAGSGLAGEHVQPGRQPQLRLLDQQEILDAQLLKHACRSTSRRRRIARAQIRLIWGTSGAQSWSRALST
jgi:hypothetical protein